MNQLQKGNVTQNLLRDINGDTWIGTVIHEVGHPLQGTYSGRQLERLFLSEDGLMKAATEDYLSRGYSEEYFDKEASLKHSLKIQHSDGSEEILENARSITNDDVMDYLNKVKSGDIKGHAYIPVRKDTPQVIIDTMAQVNETVENRSFVMQVNKARQAMMPKKGSSKVTKDGHEIRPHGLTPSNIVEIMDHLDNPIMAIYQTNRVDRKTGKRLPNNTVFFVEYDNNGKESVAIIEFDSEIDPKAIGTESGETRYHTVVTVFEPDVERDGDLFDYAEKLLSNENNFELEIVRGQSKRSATREIVPNTSSKLPSKNSIAQENDTVKGEISDSIQKAEAENKLKIDEAEQVEQTLSKFERLTALIQKEESGVELTAQERKVYDQYKSETFAFAAQRVLGNREFVKKMILEDTSTAEKIIAKLKEIGKSIGTRRSADAKKAAAFVKKAEALYMNAIAEVGATFKDGKIHLANREEEEGENVTKNIKYSLKSGAEDDVQKALNNKNYREDIYLTESSPSILIGQKGVRNLPMLMKASHIRENIFTEQEARKMGLKVDEHIHYHGLGKELFLKIIDGLDDVTLAYRGTKNASDSSRRQNYFLLISQYKDANGNTVNVPVYIDEWGQYNRVMIETNKIATAFGRDNFNEYIKREIKKGNLVRIKKRSTQDSVRTAVIAGGSVKNASIDSISQNEEKSTPLGENSSTIKKSKVADGEKVTISKGEWAAMRAN